MNTAQLAWFTARSSGIVAWVLATSSVLLGLALSTRLVRRKGVPVWLNSLHRYLGTLTLVFTAVHLGALVADNWVHFGVADLLVPMASTWRPGAVAWGIVALYLLVAVQVTSWCKRWLPRRLWHAVHLTSIPLFVAGTVHGAQAGADWSHPAVQWGALVGSAGILFLLLFRTMSGSGRRRRGRKPGVGVGDRVAGLRSRRADGGNALGNQGLDGGVEPAVGERGGQRREHEDAVRLLVPLDDAEFLPGRLRDPGSGPEAVNIGL